MRAAARRSESELAAAARAGDRRARDELMAAGLPLVYTIVRRALGDQADADDVVQDVMLRAVRQLPTLRAPDRFRSWLAAIAVHQIGTHLGRAARVRDRSAPLEEADTADTGLEQDAVRRAELSGQRRQTARAGRWLDPDDRLLLPLWWLEHAEELTRAQVAEALGVSVAHAGVRVQRLRERLDAGRAIVAALEARPRCPGLAGAVADWDGVPGPLWRKRLLRHVRDCPVCTRAAEGLLPAERLFPALALLPVPAVLSVDLLARLAAGAGTAAGTTAGAAAAGGAIGTTAAGGTASVSGTGIAAAAGGKAAISGAGIAATAGGVAAAGTTVGGTAAATGAASGTGAGIAAAIAHAVGAHPILAAGTAAVLAAGATVGAVEVATPPRPAPTVAAAPQNRPTALFSLDPGSTPVAPVPPPAVSEPPESTGTSAAPGGPAMSLGPVSLEAANAPGSFVSTARNAGVLVTAGPASAEAVRRQATFEIVAGLADPDCYSFRFADGRYLRHASWRLLLNLNERTELFRGDATFCARAGDTAGSVALESGNYPGYFLRHRGGELWVDRFDGSETFRDDRAFLLRPPLG